MAMTEPGFHGEDATELDRRFLHQFIVLDRLGVTAGAAFVVVANGAYFRNSALWGIVPVLLGLAAALTVALRLTDRHETFRPLVLIASGNWAVAVVVPLFLPILWPVMILTVLAPIVLAAPHLERGRIYVALGLSGVVTAVVASIGLLNDDGGAIPDIDDEVELLLVIGSLIAQIVPIGFIAWHNNRRQRQQIMRVLELNDSLRDSRSEVVLSRRRVAEAADTERRRLERDLHDGAQQRLVSLGVRVRLLDEQITDESVRAKVSDLSQELDEAVGELRDLAHGIYPTLLQTHGLAAALRAVARRSPSPVEVAGNEGDGIGTTTSAALYFVALEALTNTTKHAPDAAVRIELTRTNVELTLKIEDDGPGFDSGLLANSHGLQNMKDRTAAAGGNLNVTSTPGAGCTIEATVTVR
ncbi:MAG: hypothetical protein GXP35_07135 [Actinobacteria bacterium]|nr:hypothetical protein [Actinomycetota bacterium]